MSVSGSMGWYLSGTKKALRDDREGVGRVGLFARKRCRLTIIRSCSVPIKVGPVGDGQAVEAKGRVCAWIVSNEDQQAEVLGEGVAKLEPPSVVMHPLIARLVRLVPRYWEAHRSVNLTWGVAGLDDDELDGLAKGLASHVVELSSTEVDQGAELGV